MMNFIRRAVLYDPHLRGRTLATVAGGGLVDSSNKNAANLVWKHRRRSGDSFAAFSHPWSRCICTSGVRNDDRREGAECCGWGAGPGVLSTRPFALPLPRPRLGTTNSRSRGTVTLPFVGAASMYSAHWFGDGGAGRPVAGFSTMPHSTSASGNGGDAKKIAANEDNLSSLPASQRARALFRKYGAVFVGTYLGVYFATLLSLFASLDLSLLDPDFLSQVFRTSKDLACETADVIGPTGAGASMNEAADAYAREAIEEMAEDRRTLAGTVSGYLRGWEWSRPYAERLSENPHLANLVVAWFLVKFTEPVRLAAAVVLTPKVARALGRKNAEEK